MTTMPPALRFAIALSLLAPIPYAAFAQSQSVELQAESRKDWYEAAPGLGPVVLNAPFSAVADERWVSPELQLLVYSRTEDSKIGVVEHRLTSISQAEPPAELFEIPAAYSATAANYPITFHNPYRADTQEADHVRLGRR
jgi:hypothetical protein